MPILFHFACLRQNAFQDELQLTIENSSCQGTKKVVWVIESSSFREMGLKQWK